MMGCRVDGLGLGVRKVRDTIVLGLGLRGLRFGVERLSKHGAASFASAASKSKVLKLLVLEVRLLYNSCPRF